MPEPANQQTPSGISPLNENRSAPSLLQRIAASEDLIVEDFINKYGDFLWYLAKKNTRTKEDAEDAAQEIFRDLWRSAACFDPEKSSEIAFVALVALRRLIICLRREKSSLECGNPEEIKPVCPNDFKSEMQIRYD